LCRLTISQRVTSTTRSALLLRGIRAFLYSRGQSIEISQRSASRLTDDIALLDDEVLAGPQHFRQSVVDNTNYVRAMARCMSDRRRFAVDAGLIVPPRER